MEIDSGASSSIISEETFLRVLHGRPKLQRVSTVLRTWSNKTVPVLGSITVSAARDSRSAKLKLLVARGSGPSLLGRNWNWSSSRPYNADGTHEPIYFASRVLQPSEQKYAQVDREGLAFVFAVQKFRCFVLGRKFTIFTDHKPLLGLLQQGSP
ncbi:hypothetical protein D918_07400 [Trichuris suis]|nr:hypothetical protein D918_07400 [Trichuris suis]